MGSVYIKSKEGAAKDVLKDLVSAAVERCCASLLPGALRRA